MNLSIYQYYKARREEFNTLRQMAHFALQKADLLFSQIQNGKFEEKRKMELLGEQIYFTNRSMYYEVEAAKIKEIINELSIVQQSSNY